MICRLNGEPRASDATEKVSRHEASVCSWRAHADKLGRRRSRTGNASKNTIGRSVQRIRKMWRTLPQSCVAALFASQVGRGRRQTWAVTLAKSLWGGFLGTRLTGGCPTPPSDKPTEGRRYSEICAGPGGAPPAQLLLVIKHAGTYRNARIYGDEEQTSLRTLICA